MRFRDLQQPGEIPVTGGVPQVGTELGLRAHSIRISAKERNVDPLRLNLLPWYRKATVRLRAALALQLVEAA